MGSLRLTEPGCTTSDRPAARTAILSARFTEPERKELEDFAWSKQKTFSDWAREVLLREVHNQHPEQMEMHLFSELCGIQMLLMNALEPLLQRSGMPAEQAAGIFRHVQKTKLSVARDILARRAANVGNPDLT
ncbi:MAG TPA: hypothetical protein VFB43_00015 [Terracidiphilus sp.]|nr:hypothetical protein [Terracidiphilus sp.]